MPRPQPDLEAYTTTSVQQSTDLADEGLDASDSWWKSLVMIKVDGTERLVSLVLRQADKIRLASPRSVQPR